MKNTTLSRIAARFKRTEPFCADVLQTLRLLSNKTRFRIVCALSMSDLPVSQIVSTVGLSRQPNISIQLRLLTSAGLISSRRSGRTRTYRLVDPELRSLISFLERTYSRRPGRSR